MIPDDEPFKFAEPRIEAKPRTGETIRRNGIQTLWNRMVTLTKDSKGDTYIITNTDAEGYHRQLNLTRDDLLHLMNLIIQSDV